MEVYKLYKELLNLIIDYFELIADLIIFTENKRNKNGKGIPGMPQYTYGDTVTFKFDRGGEYTVHTGKIVVVDSYGSLEFHMEQPSYDIEVEMDDGGHCLMKHVPESDILNS